MIRINPEPEAVDDQDNDPDDDENCAYTHVDLLSLGRPKRGAYGSRRFRAASLALDRPSHPIP